MQIWKLVTIELTLIFAYCLVLVFSVFNSNQNAQYPTQSNIQVTRPN